MGRKENQYDDCSQKIKQLNTSLIFISPIRQRRRAASTTDFNLHPPQNSLISVIIEITLLSMDTSQ